LADAKDSDRRAIYLSLIAREIDASLLDRCLDAAARLDEDMHQSKVLAALALRMDGAQLVRASEWAARFKDSEAKAVALAALAPQLTGTGQAEALRIAVTAALTIASPRTKAWTLARLAPQLTGESRQRAIDEGLRAAEAIDEPEARAHALVAYQPAAGDGVGIARRIRRAISEALRVRWHDQRERVLTFCASEGLFSPPTLSDDVVGALLEGVSSIRNDWHWL
jgi:hypothetical protein